MCLARSTYFLNALGNLNTYYLFYCFKIRTYLNLIKVVHIPG